jgi:hypothetical protein
MGCCSSIESSHRSNSNNTGKQRGHEIDEQIKKDRQNMSNEVKLLLLGKLLHSIPLFSSLTPFF